MDPITCIENLPNEMLVEIFSYLTVKDLVHLVQHVCSRWKEASQTDQLWTTVVYEPSFSPRERDVEIASTLKQAPRLQILILRTDTVTPVLFRAITQNCRYLKKLVFGNGGGLSLSDLTSLVRKCPDIEDLILPRWYVYTLEASKIISQFNNIKILNFNYFFILDDYFLKPIADGCPKLQHIYLSNTAPKYEELAYFLEKKGCQLLTLGMTYTTKDNKCNLPLLSECTALKTLLLSHLHCNCSANEVKPLRTLRKMTCLKSFSLDCDDINSVIRMFQDECMNQLEELYLNNYLDCEDRLADAIVDNCPRLKLLNLKCHNLSDRSLKKLFTLSQLQGLTVNLGPCRTYMPKYDTRMPYIARCIKLWYLDLWKCKKLTEKSMKLIVDFSDLRILRITSCNVYGLPLHVIPTKLKHLTLLCLDTCENVDKRAIHQLRSQVPHLKIYVQDPW